jgi:CheY-like chemotaxis protein
MFRVMLTSTSAIYNRDILNSLKTRKEQIKVLLIGNNPIEMTNVYDKLRSYRSKNYIADVCFSVQDSVKKMLKAKPDCVLIDDNVVVSQLKEFFNNLKKNGKLKNIPIVLLKSTNFSSAIQNDAQDYLLKGNLDSEILNNTIEKNLRIRQLQR